MAQSQWDMGTNVTSHSSAHTLSTEERYEIWALSPLQRRLRTRVLDNPGPDGRAYINLHPYVTDGAEFPKTHGHPGFTMGTQYEYERSPFCVQLWNLGLT